MTILLLMAAAAAPMAPQAPVPAWGGSSGAPGTVLFNLFIDPQGRPMTCDIIQITGKNYADVLCERVRRASFRPARGPDGKAAYGFYQALAHYGAAGPVPAGILPDLSVSVKPSPRLREKREIKVAVVVDPAGKIAACDGAGSAADAPLVKIACAQFTAQWDDTPLEDPQGFGRHYVRELTAAFVPESAKP